MEHIDSISYHDCRQYVTRCIIKKYIVTSSFEFSCCNRQLNQSKLSRVAVYCIHVYPSTRPEPAIAAHWKKWNACRARAHMNWSRIPFYYIRLLFCVSVGILNFEWDLPQISLSFKCYTRNARRRKIELCPGVDGGATHAKCSNNIVCRNWILWLETVSTC